MSATATIAPFETPRPDPVAIARRLGPDFAARAAVHDQDDSFVAENFEALKAAGLVEAGVPREFGGAGADIETLGEMLREIGRRCSSTALAFAMHTHQVAVPAWRWQNQGIEAVVPLLKRIAAERILVLSSGGSDWVAGSGKAERVDGGYKITARKIFASASPVGDILMTSAVLEEGENGPEVLHFGLPLSSPKVTVLPTWRTLGMRGTASNDVMVDGHVVPEQAVALRRPQGQWHPLFHILSMIAIPLIYAVYLGVAEEARDIALGLAKRRRPSEALIDMTGRMETELGGARLAYEAMMGAHRTGPSPETTNRTMIARSLFVRHALATADLAMEVAGGAGFYREHGLERRFRDIQAARYHPMQAPQQQAFAGRLALGLDIAKTF